jgi:hypothetical protein
MLTGSRFELPEDPTIEPLEFGNTSSPRAEKLDGQFTSSLSHSGRSMGWVHVQRWEDWLSLRLG